MSTSSRGIERLLLFVCVYKYSELLHAANISLYYLLQVEEMEIPIGNQLCLHLLLGSNMSKHLIQAIVTVQYIL